MHTGSKPLHRSRLLRLNGYPQSGLWSLLTSPTASVLPLCTFKMVVGGPNVPLASWRLSVTADEVSVMRSGRLSWLTSTMAASIAFTGAPRIEDTSVKPWPWSFFEQVQAPGLPADQKVLPA